jgi:hypothetical protein
VEVSLHSGGQCSTYNEICATCQVGGLPPESEPSRRDPRRSHRFLTKTTRESDRALWR